MRSVPFDLFATPRPNSVMGSAADNPMSVCDLALQTRQVVETRLRPVWVRGEIADFIATWRSSRRRQTVSFKCFDVRSTPRVTSPSRR